MTIYTIEKVQMSSLMMTFALHYVKKYKTFPQEQRKWKGWTLIHWSLKE